jgi:CheY-like chemotaxis protein
MASPRAQVLFVDDDAKLLELVRELAGVFAGEQWDVFTASSVAEGLALLQQHKITLLVLDVHMPVVDGVQFLHILQRKYPNVTKVVLTGDATGAFRASCLNAGAELFLEKPREAGGWESIFATLRELARLQPDEGFRGVLRRVGLQDIVQMECLAHNSSVLEVAAADAEGLIYIEDGQIIHACCGEQTGEPAFYALLAAKGGEFRLKPFEEPPARSLSGQWEFLLMEAARRRDERAEQTASEGPPPEDLLAELPPKVAVEPRAAPVVSQASPPGREAPERPFQPKIEEVLICSARGDVLYEWQCENTNARIGLLEFLSRKSVVLAQGLPVGEFDRVEIQGETCRTVVQIQPARSLLVRSRVVPAAAAPAGGSGA